jgi:hypothetical protein
MILSSQPGGANYWMVKSDQGLPPESLFNFTARSVPLVSPFFPNGPKSRAISATSAAERSKTLLRTVRAPLPQAHWVNRQFPALI